MPQTAVTPALVKISSVPSLDVKKDGASEVAKKDAITTASNNNNSAALLKILEDVLVDFDSSELTDDTDLFSMGVSSVAAMQIVSRISKDLGIEIDLPDLFSQQTIGDLKAFIANRPSTKPPKPHVRHTSCEKITRPPPPTNSAKAPDNRPSAPVTTDASAKWMAIIQEELDVDDLADNTDLFSIGVGSLTAIRIISRFNDELGMDISVADLFMQRTVGELRALLTTKSKEPDICEHSLPFIEIIKEILDVDEDMDNSTDLYSLGCVT